MAEYASSGEKEEDKRPAALLAVDEEISAMMSTYKLEWNEIDARYQKEWNAMLHVDKTGKEGSRWQYGHQNAYADWLARRRVAVTPLLQRKHAENVEVYQAKLLAMNADEFRAAVTAQLVALYAEYGAVATIDLDRLEEA